MSASLSDRFDTWWEQQERRPYDSKYSARDAYEAAYKMAIEDAARACDDIASALPRRTLERTEAFRCASAVRALAEGL